MGGYKHYLFNIVLENFAQIKILIFEAIMNNTKWIETI